MQITIVIYQPKISIFVLIAKDSVISFKYYFSAIFEYSEIKRPSEHVRFINWKIILHKTNVLSVDRVCLKRQTN